MYNYGKGGPTPEKAQRFLQDGQIYGHPLSDRQREFFANLAGTDINGNLLDEETGEPVQPINQDEQEFKYGGGFMKKEKINTSDVATEFIQLMKDGGVNNLAKFIRKNSSNDGVVNTNPSANVDDIVTQKKDQFKTFIQGKVMDNMAKQEAGYLLSNQMYKEFGGNIFADGGPTDRPETPYEHALRMQREKLARESQLLPQPSNDVKISQVNEPSSYNWKANPFDQQSPVTPGQVQPMTMTGQQAPSVVPSTTDVMDKLTPNATRFDPNQQSQPATQSANINYQQSSMSTVPYGQLAAEGIINTMEGITSLINRGEDKKKKKLARERMNADAIFTPVTGSNNRGSYDVNTGGFRIDQMVPQQFRGNSFGQIGSSSGYALGGEHMMEDDKIKELIKQGYKIDYLD